MKNTGTKIGEKIFTPIFNYLIFLNTTNCWCFNLKKGSKIHKGIDSKEFHVAKLFQLHFNH
jgi:hypothetical protein